MRIISKLASRFAAGFLLVGIALILVLQEQTLNRVRQENGSLRQQVDQLVARADQLASEKSRLSTLVEASQTNTSVTLAQEPSRELLRLRGEVGRLSVQQREIE